MKDGLKKKRKGKKDGMTIEKGDRSLKNTPVDENRKKVRLRKKKRISRLQNITKAKDHSFQASSKIHKNPLNCTQKCQWLP